MTANVTPFPGTAQRLAAMFYMSDSEHERCPEVWRDTAACLITYLEDEGMTTEEAAAVAGLPVAVVAEYRWRVGL